MAEINMNSRLISAIDFNEVLAFTKQLISIPGHQDIPEYESKVAEKIFDKLEQEGINVEIMEVGNKRYNVIGKISGSGEGKSLMLNSHLDTVPPYNMPYPFNPIIKNGRLYGRGSVDVKSILSAMCYTLITMKRLNIKPMGDIIFTGVADEESGSLGTRELLKNQLVDMAIVGEPTNLQIGLAHKGVEWIEVTFYGQAGHGGIPDSGKNAIYMASSFIEEVKEKLIPQFKSRKHSLVGESTINIGMVNGGKRPTVIPDVCTIRLDRRWLPNENRKEVLDEIENILITLGKKDNQFSAEMTTILGDDAKNFPPLDTKNTYLVEKLSQSIQIVQNQQPKLVGLPYWTDAALLSSIGNIPTVVFGPGDIAQAHSNEEYIELGQLYTAAKAYLLAAYNICC